MSSDQKPETATQLSQPADKPFDVIFKENIIAEFNLKDQLGAQKKKNVFDVLASMKGKEKEIEAFCKKNSERITERVRFINELLPFCIDHNNAPTLNALLNANRDITDNFKNFLFDLTEPQKKTLKNLLSLSEIKSQFKKELLNEFVIYGHLTDAGLKLTMAQLASRKDRFNPTVISAKERFSDYLNTLKLGLCDSPRPVREVFIVGDPNFTLGTHWVAGIIEVDSNNKEKMLLMDSIGDKLPSYCVRLFAEEFPDGILYRNNEQRQYQPKGCSIYAIDDVRHAFTVEKYLKQNIFDYFDAQKYPLRNFTLDNVPVQERYCHLPLSFQRSMQSKLEETIAARPEEERESVINRKEMKAEDCRKKDLRKIDDENQNRYIPYLFNKIFNRNVEFLENLSDDEAKLKMQDFSLENFQKRMLQQFIENATKPAKSTNQFPLENGELADSKTNVITSNPPSDASNLLQETDRLVTEVSDLKISPSTLSTADQQIVLNKNNSPNTLNLPQGASELLIFSSQIPKSETNVNTEDEKQKEFSNSDSEDRDYNFDVFDVSEDENSDINTKKLSDESADEDASDDNEKNEISNSPRAPFSRGSATVGVFFQSARTAPTSLEILSAPPSTIPGLRRSSLEE